MRGFLALGAVLTTLVAWLFWAAPESHADRYASATTEVSWSGSNCVQVYGASQRNPYLIGSPVWQCDGGPGPHFAQWYEYRSTGQVVGVDPEMGANAWIKCTLWVNGRIEWTDFATAGDGHQVSCLRYVN